MEAGPEERPPEGGGWRVARLGGGGFCGGNRMRFQAAEACGFTQQDVGPTSSEMLSPRRGGGKIENSTTISYLCNNSVQKTPLQVEGR